MAKTGKLIDPKHIFESKPDEGTAASGTVDMQALKGDSDLTKNGPSNWANIGLLAKMPDWLVSYRDTGRVCQALAEAVPELREGSWELKDCDVGHIRYKHQFWTTLYQLTLNKPGETEDFEVSLQGKFYPPGVLSGSTPWIEGTLGQPDWKVRLPKLNLELEAREPDKALAALEFLTDPQRSLLFLEDNIRVSAPAYQNLRIQSCRPDVVRYNPGSRCTVVYHLGFDPLLAQNEAWPDVVVAKTYHGEKGQNAFDSMTALWQSPLGEGQVVKIAEPLAYLPEHKVLVQGPIREERTLKNRISTVLDAPTPEMMQILEHEMRQTAAGLAALHSSNVSLGRLWTWEDEMAEVQNQFGRLAEVLPDLKAAAEPLLNRLNQLASETPADPLGPSHGSFRPAQVLINQGEIGFIDFDSFCQSEPANDLALFLGTTLSISLTPPKGDGRSAANRAARQSRFESAYGLCEQFLDDYQQHHPVSRQRVALWQALNIFTFVMHGWTKIKLWEIDDIVYLLESFLAVKEIRPNQ